MVPCITYDTVGEALGAGVDGQGLPDRRPVHQLSARVLNLNSLRDFFVNYISYKINLLTYERAHELYKQFRCSKMP